MTVVREEIKDKKFSQTPGLFPVQRQDFFFFLIKLTFFLSLFFFPPPPTTPWQLPLLFKSLLPSSECRLHHWWALTEISSVGCREQKILQSLHNCLWILQVWRSPWQHKQVKSSVIIPWWGEATERALSSQTHPLQQPLGLSPSLAAGSHPYPSRVQTAFNTLENTIYKIDTSVSHWLLIRALLGHYISLTQSPSGKEAAKDLKSFSQMPIFHSFK